jgi:hypothetical protein
VAITAVVVSTPVTVGRAAAERLQEHSKREVFTATFDALPEGAVGATLTDGGITFYGLDHRDPDPPGNETFFIEWAEGLSEFPSFSPPNALSPGAMSLGPTFGAGRTGEFRMSIGRKARAAQLELFDLGVTPGNTATLEAIRHGRVVATDSVTLPGGGELTHHTLSISGRRFDELRLVGSGEVDSGVLFALFDNVRIIT